ncbi:MAG: hypothetical protein AMXMBFR57_23170 [Acidimicrobiia bacterium]
MFIHTRRLVVATIAVLLVTAAPARADWFLTPFLGLTFGDDARGEHMTYGGTLRWVGDSMIGFEIDASVSSDILNMDDDVDFSIDDNRATTVMANLVLGGPGDGARGVRPYVSGGGGYLRLTADGVVDALDVERESFAVNAGGGITGMFSDVVGMRADIRYFRRLQDDDIDDDDVDLDLGQFGFWRATVGLSFRF